MKAIALAASLLVPQVCLAQGEPRDERSADARARAAEAARETTLTTIEGSVWNQQGEFAAGAVVVTSAGGRALTDAYGSFRLEFALPLDATSVQVTAVRSAGNTSAVGTATVAIRSPGDVNWGGVLTLTQGGSCPASWLPEFGEAQGLSGTVDAIAIFDDGSGPALYLGGRLSSAGRSVVNGVARWDGATWSPVGNWITAPGPAIVYALTVFDDGSGPALYAGGRFAPGPPVGVPQSNIAKLVGTAWSSLGSGTNGEVHALTVFDDGGGAALYVGGIFTSAGGVSANHVAKWNGTSWSALGSGVTDSGGYPRVAAFALFDDGGGPALYASGEFDVAGGVPASSIAKWDGASWSALGLGVAGYAYALATFDDGSGPALYAGGYFASAGGVSASRIAKWDGANWSALGAGLGGQSGSQSVQALSVFDDGGGPALYAGGGFTLAGGAPANCIARWDGASWSTVANGVEGQEVLALLALDDGAGPALVAGGTFTGASGAGAKNVARWSGTAWSALGGGIDWAVEALTVFDDGSGAALYAGGLFTSAGGVAAHHIAKWNGTSWAPLGEGMNHEVDALAVFDDGGGAALYAGGGFSTAGGVSANGVAKWNGSSWSSLGSGVFDSRPFGNARVDALSVYDDGSGHALYAGGSFTSAGGVDAFHIAKWNGTSWAAVGGGASEEVMALTVYDGGPGPELVAGGAFNTMGGIIVHRIARWDGTTWRALIDSGFTAKGTDGFVRSLTVFDDGPPGSPALFVGGNFTRAGNVMTANRIARWDGSSWSAVGSGFAGTSVVALTAFDDNSGGGAELYASGGLTSSGGTAMKGIAKWNGTSWSPVGGGMNSAAEAFAVFDDGSGYGPALFAGGDFLRAFDSLDSYLARWQACDSLAPTLACPSSVIVRDPLSSPMGEFVSFSVTASDDRDPAPTVVCVPPSGSFFPAGETLVTCTATDVSGNQSTCTFPVFVNRKVRAR
jgi:hypothetical protein